MRNCRSSSSVKIMFHLSTHCSWTKPLLHFYGIPGSLTIRIHEILESILTCTDKDRTRKLRFRQSFVTVFVWFVDQRFFWKNGKKLSRIPNSFQRISTIRRLFPYKPNKKFRNQKWTRLQTIGNVLQQRITPLYRTKCRLIELKLVLSSCDAFGR
jgi:hypothetical protein